MVPLERPARLVDQLELYARLVERALEREREILVRERPSRSCQCGRCKALRILGGGRG